MSRFWQVYITLAGKEEGKFHRNRTLGVAAPDIQSAIDLVLKEYPGAAIWTVQHRGEIHHSIIEHQLGWAHNEDNPQRR